MTLNDPTITDWIQAIAASATTIITLILLFQLRFAKRQLESTGKQIELAREQMEIGHRWNRLNATFTYFAHDLFNQLEREAADKVRPLGIDLYKTTEPLDADIIKKIHESPDIYFAVKALTNLLEDYSTAVRTGAFEPKCAYSIMSGIIVRYAKVLAPFIGSVREDDLDDTYIEIERLGNEWAADYQTETEERRKKLQATQDAIKNTKREIEESKGARPVFNK